MIGFLVFIIGLVFGSFMNVCIYRIPAHESVVTGPSHCPACGKQIKWYDLVPVLSFLILRGRCRFCKTSISPRYPAVELLNGTIWMLLYCFFGLTPIFIILCIVFSCVMVYGFIKYDGSKSAR
ncbi:MAG TPA: prepilin peptidase [Clostridiales bacterium]|nr:prepilin peptidase [Clostridiales bacterium]